MRRPIHSTMTALLCTVLAVGFLDVVPAHAETPPDAPNGIDVEAIQHQFDQLGVPVSKRDLLLSKIALGVPLDADRGTPPSSVEHLTLDGFAVTRERFSDGSVIETGLEIGTTATAGELAAIIAEVSRGGESVTAATGLRYCATGTSGGVFYASNCEVYYHGISWSSAFRANYQRWAAGSAAQYVSGSAFTVTYTLCITSENVNSIEGATRIRYAITLAPACIGSIPFWLDLKVTSSTAYATYGP